MQLVRKRRRAPFVFAIVASSKAKHEGEFTKMKKAVKGLIIAAGVIITLAVGGSIVLGGVIADKILHQNDGKDTADNSLKQLELWGYDIDSFNNNYSGVEVSAPAADGNVVPGTLFEEGSDVCAVLVHGAGGDRVSIYPLAEQYLMRGYDVIAIDQRGCGANPDDRVTFGINESLDVAAMVEYARTELGYSKVIVHGQSMGAQTAVVYAANVERGAADAADAVICDSPVPGMELILRLMFGESVENAYSPVTNYLIGTSKSFMKVFDRIDYDDADTIALASEIDIPVMIVLSERDEVCLPEYVQQVYDNISVDERAIYYADSEHIEGVIDDPEGYMTSVENFLSSVGVNNEA